MATYGVDPRTGVDRAGKTSFTGWSGIHGDQGSNGPSVPAPAGTVLNNGQLQSDHALSAVFRKNGGNRGIGWLLQALIGNAVGAPIGVRTKKRIAASDISTNGDAGGIRYIETVDLIPSRNTTAADAAAVKAMFARATAPASYPTDVGGNGGGGKVRY